MHLSQWHGDSNNRPNNPHTNQILFPIGVRCEIGAGGQCVAVVVSLRDNELEGQLPVYCSILVSVAPIAYCSVLVSVAPIAYPHPPVGFSHGKPPFSLTTTRISQKYEGLFGICGKFLFG